MTKILVDKAVIEQALLALRIDDLSLVRESVIALRAALEQPQVEQEPVAWRCFDGEGDYEYRTEEPDKDTRSWAARYNREWEPLYTHSQNLNCKSTQHRLATLWGYEKPQPPRHPLTDEQITELADAHMEAFAQFVGAGEVWFEGEKEFVRAIERAHGIGESND